VERLSEKKKKPNRSDSSAEPERRERDRLVSGRKGRGKQLGQKKRKGGAGIFALGLEKKGGVHYIAFGRGGKDSKLSSKQDVGKKKVLFKRRADRYFLAGRGGGGKGGFLFL